MNKFIEALKKQKAKKVGKVVQKDYSKLTLKELRVKFPDVTAKSKKEFLEKI